MPNLSAQSISIVIPVLNAAAFLPVLLPALLRQTPTPPLEILLIDSDSSDQTRTQAAQYKNTRIIPAGLFSHGRARNLGTQEAHGDIIVFLSQDALPANNDWLHELLAPFQDPMIAATFSRQTPRADANPMETFFLHTHFPPVEKRYSRQSGQTTLAFQRDVFFSNVSSAVRRDVLLKHPFDDQLIMSEDQQFARDIIMAGFSVAYAPASIVVHSHNYTCLQAFKRYFDSVYSLTQIFPRHDLKASMAMGAQYLKQEARMILHHPRWLLHYVGYVFAKAMGTILGHCADKLPLPLLKRISMHAYYWPHPHRLPPTGAPTPPTLNT